jgi:hypothetical protein
MRALTVRRNAQGWFDVCHGRTRLCIVVVSNLEWSLGLTPSAASIRDAVRETAPAYGVTDQTPIQWN